MEATKKSIKVSDVLSDQAACEEIVSDFCVPNTARNLVTTDANENGSQ